MSKAHALVIDDNMKNVNVLAGLLSLEDVSSSLVTDPRRLDATLGGLTQVDVVFLDLEMPGLNGFDVLEKLHRTPQFENVPIVAYTVHTSEIDVVAQHGFHSFLGKPLDPDKFPEQLSRILQGERVWDRS